MRVSSRVRRILAILLGGYVLTLAAQTPGRPGRTKTIKQLREDLSTAMGNASLTDQQKQTLETSRETLQQALDARQNGQEVDNRKVDQALKDVRRVFKSGSFRDEDRQAVEQDLQNLQRPRLQHARNPHPTDPPGWRRPGVYRRWP